MLTIADVAVFANFARLAATALLGWWFLGYFEALSWVVLVACIIPSVDAYSVWCLRRTCFKAERDVCRLGAQCLPACGASHCQGRQENRLMLPFRQEARGPSPKSL